MGCMHFYSASWIGQLDLDLDWPVGLASWIAGWIACIQSSSSAKRGQKSHLRARYSAINSNGGAQHSKVQSKATPEGNARTMGGHRTVQPALGRQC